MVAPAPTQGSPVAPRQPASKSAAAAPKLNSDMEMADIPGSGRLSEEGPALQQPKQQEPLLAEEEDVMHLARIGDIPAMEKLFESKGYDATYTDDEGITPLHVSLALRWCSRLHHSARAQQLLTGVSLVGGD